MSDTITGTNRALRSSTAQRRADLCASTADNAAWSAHVGLGETYFPAFMLLVGGGEIAAGLIASLPQIVGATVQLLSPLGVSLVGSLKRWTVLTAVVQSLSFGPLVIAAWSGGIPANLLFLVAAVYWGSAMAGGPSWNTWIGMIVPVRLRARYFARRTRIGNVCLLLAVLAGGSLLQWGESRGFEYAAFGAMFLTAGLLRLLSSYFLSRQSEKTAIPGGFRVVSPLELARRLRGGNDVRLLAYLLAISFSCWTAAPFFAPYMLETLKLSYGGYVVLIATMQAARILSLPLLGTLAHRLGADRLLWVGGIAIMPLTALWAFTTQWWTLMGLQLLAGIAWAAYELAALLMTFETIRESERTSVLTLFNFCNTIAISLGSLVGGMALAALGVSAEGYHTIFVLSSILRALALLLLFRVACSPFRAPRESA